MDTRSAFEKMLTYNINEVCKRLGIENSTFYILKHRLKKKEHISIDNMEKMLRKFGFKVIQYQTWKEPTQ